MASRQYNRNRMQLENSPVDLWGDVYMDSATPKLISPSNVAGMPLNNKGIYKVEAVDTGPAGMMLVELDDKYQRLLSFDLAFVSGGGVKVGSTTYGAAIIPKPAAPLYNIPLSRVSHSMCVVEGITWTAADTLIINGVTFTGSDTGAGTSNTYKTGTTDAGSGTNTWLTTLADHATTSAVQSLAYAINNSTTAGIKDLVYAQAAYYKISSTIHAVLILYSRKTEFTVVAAGTWTTHITPSGKSTPGGAFLLQFMSDASAVVIPATTESWRMHISLSNSDAN